MEDKNLAKDSKKTWIIVGIVVAVLFVIGLIAGGASSGGSIFSSSPNNGQVYSVGQAVENREGVIFRIDKVENTKMLGNEYLGDTTNGNFIVLTITVTNLSRKNITVYGSSVDLYNDKNVKYESQTSLFIDYIISEDIGVGISKTYQVLFETPYTTQQAKYIAKVGYSIYTADRNRISFKLYD